AVAVRTAIRRVDFQCGIDQEFRYVVRGGAPVDLLACNAGQVGNAGVGVVAGFLRDHRQYRTDVFRIRVDAFDAECRLDVGGPASAVRHVDGHAIRDLGAYS